MCGRYVQFYSPEMIKENFPVKEVPFKLTPSYNIAPTQEVLAIVRREEENRLEKLFWGLVPSWAKDISMGPRLINARAETVATKPIFRSAFKRRRCLIIANGYYEWQKKKDGKGKQPWYLTLVSGRPFAFAGLWESWQDKEKGEEEEPYNSCTIITCDADKAISHIHDRMPVILARESYEDWLDLELQDPKELQSIIGDNRIPKMKCYPISTFVNSPKNNTPECIKPI